MNFNDEQREAFLNDVPFFENGECFCLGNTLEEAGAIVQQIVKEAERA